MIVNRPREIIEEHKKIIAAVKNKDAILAEALMKEHFENTMKAISDDREKITEQVQGMKEECNGKDL